MKIGEKIRALRKAKKLTQEQLAEYMNVSPQAVSKWETGVSAPDIDMLPRLAVFFQTSVDELLDFDRRKIDEEIEALVAESVSLRSDPNAAEAFYRKALKMYPNSDVLLNCLLMVLPNDRSGEKMKIGERLLECTTDDAVKYDVIRILAETYHSIGENAMAEYYLSQMPELYFLKTEVAAFVREGEDRREAIIKTETVCLGILTEMFAMRIRTVSGEERARYESLARKILELFGEFEGHRERAARLIAELKNGTVLDF